MEKWIWWSSIEYYKARNNKIQLAQNQKLSELAKELLEH